jgi:hypothetical protein
VKVKAGKIILICIGLVAGYAFSGVLLGLALGVYGYVCAAMIESGARADVRREMLISLLKTELKKANFKTPVK